MSSTSRVVSQKVGRSPWTAADALVGLLQTTRKPDQGVRRGRGRPPHRDSCRGLPTQYTSGTLKNAAENAGSVFAGAYRAATVSTYIVRSVSFLAEYFYRPALHPMFTGLRRGLSAGPTLALRSNTAPSRSRLGNALNLPGRDREGVGGRYRRTLWFRLRRVRERVRDGLFQHPAVVTPIWWRGAHAPVKPSADQEQPQIEREAYARGFVGSTATDKGGGANEQYV
jgi:hypothetical protein